MVGHSSWFVSLAALMVLGLGRQSEAEEKNVALRVPSEAEVAAMPGASVENPKPSDFLTVPAGALDYFFEAMNRRRPGEPAVIFHYGDSHSASGWFGSELVASLAPGWKTSPGYVSVTYPLDVGAKIKKIGKWEVDNWLYTKHKGPFGPFGVAYTASEPGSAIELSFTNREDVPRTVTCFFDDSWGTPPFELRVNDMPGVVARFEPTAKPNARDYQPPREMPEEFVDEAMDVARAHLGSLSVEVPAGASGVMLQPFFTPKKKREAEEKLRFYGCLTRNADAEIEIDIMGVGGTVIAHPLRRSGQEQLAYIRDRNPAMFTLWYGTNNTGDSDFDPERYRNQQADMVERIRKAAPDAACLIIGLPDRSTRPSECFLNKKQLQIASKPRSKRSEREKKILNTGKLARICNPDSLLTTKGRKTIYPVESVKSAKDWEAQKEYCQWHTMARVLEINAIQKKIAIDQNCAFFNSYEAMGGDASFATWACETPELARADMVHLSQLGYRTLAKILAEAIREAGRDYLVRSGRQ